MIRVVIAQDLGLGALAALLETEHDFAVVATAADGREALALCEQHRPDIVLTDIEMPHLTGLELAQDIRERGLDCKVVMVTTFAWPGYLRRALEADGDRSLSGKRPAELSGTSDPDRRHSLIQSPVSRSFGVDSVAFA